jgi:dTDP-3-amino-3,4,6-trideoxy-alpha-D-glucose transaminase
MIVPFFNLQPMHDSIGGALDDVWFAAKKAGHFVLGEKVAGFERAFAAYCGVDFCLGVANGLDAITLILRGLDVRADDEIIVPANTFIATWLAVIAAGAKLVPVDCEEMSGNISTAAVEAAVTSRTKAVIAVHLYGCPADMDGLLDVCHRHGLWLIEDAAQAHGAFYRDKRIGSFGIASAFSFYPSKNLGALGDGGAIVSRDEKLIERIRLLRNYGSSKKYHHEVAGVNSRLDELQAAFLLAKLPHLDAWNEERRTIAAVYDAAIDRCPGLRRTGISNSSKPVWHLYTIRTHDRDALAQELTAKGVNTMIHYPTPPHLQPAFASLGYAEGCFPVAEKISRETLSLPIWPGMAAVEIDHVAESVISAAHSIGRVFNR